MSKHWKQRATECAVDGCEQQRRKGWSTCGRLLHWPLGISLYGAGDITPIPRWVGDVHPLAVGSDWWAQLERAFAGEGKRTDIVSNYEREQSLSGHFDV